MLKQRFLHAPAIQGDCSICHVPIDEAAIDRPVSAVHPLRTRPANVESCSQCHAAMAEKHAVVHGTLLDDCTSCHDPHGGTVRYFFPVSSAGELCLTCHSDTREGLKFVHGPVALKDCLACHNAHSSDHKGLLAREPDKLCVSCHATMVRGMSGSASIHDPARQDCVQCHQPHGGAERGFFRLAQAELCRDCHGETMERMESATFPHSAMLEGRKCSDCHDPHWSSHPALLVRASLDICMSCHREPLTTDDGRVLAAVGERVAESPFLHGPLRDGDCTPCHAAHGSEDRRLIKGAFPEDFYAPYAEGEYGLCFTCHDEAMVKRRQSMATGFRNGTHNLHFEHVNQERGRTCRACHHEHASHMPFQIRESVPFGKWELQIRFEETPNGGTCSSGCHKPRSYDRVTAVRNEG